MAIELRHDEPGRVEYALSGEVEYEAGADLSAGDVLMWARVTDQETRPGGRVKPLIGVGVPTFSRATLDSLALALDEGREVKVTVEWSRYNYGAS